MRTTYWICAVLLAFLLGIFTEKLVQKLRPPALAPQDQTAAQAGIEKLHELDKHVTILNDPKALHQLWTDDAVRLAANGPPDIGKQAIYATDVRNWADAPGFQIVSYKPDIRDVQVVNDDSAFEWGLFDAGYRPAANNPVLMIHGKVLRILHREPTGDWKFSRVMVALDSRSSNAETPQH